MTAVTDCQAWRHLAEHRRTLEGVHMRTLFEDDPDRFERFSLRVGDLLLDYSKNRATDETMRLLAALAREQMVERRRDEMLAGEKINLTEERAVLHTALRRPSSAEPLIVDGADIMPDILEVRAQMRDFSDAVRSGGWTGYSGKTITDVVNIGIGGSDLGPAMACEALAAYTRPDLRVHFVSNLDASHFTRATSGADPERTLFIIASKTFTTLETMTNAHTARRWFLDQGASESDIARHFVAVSTNEKAVVEFGIDPRNMFRFWDWVGGRYSLWSAIGLPVAIAVGMDRFEALLQGAHRMDTHFAEAPVERNMPMIMALLGVWYRNFFDCGSHAVVPYDQNLSRFAPHLQQLDMESNGKRVRRSGQPIDTYATGPIVWGEPGCNSQHSFFQWLHQGTDAAPVDFLLAANGHHPVGDHHRLLVASCLAQSRALMIGRTPEETRESLLQGGLDSNTVEQRVAHSVFPGNRPSNTLLYRRLDPFTLGMLIALYEHKVFVQGAIWDVNSFDQFGVELGKQLTSPIAALLASDDTPDDFDGSTAGLIDCIRRADE